jgi:DNA invertase Pin-like site-specific DNA recombinase
MVTRAYSYIRFSTPEQGRGDSLRRQLEASEQYASLHGLTIDTTLTFHDYGVSAFHGDNSVTGKLGSFISAIDSGDIQPGSQVLNYPEASP